MANVPCGFVWASAPENKYLPARGFDGGGEGFDGKIAGAPGAEAWPGCTASPCPSGYSPGFMRVKIGMTKSHRPASWSKRTTPSPLLRASQAPPKPDHNELVARGPYSTFPLFS